MISEKCVSKKTLSLPHFDYTPYRTVCYQKQTENERMRDKMFISKWNKHFFKVYIGDILAQHKLNKPSVYLQHSASTDRKELGRKIFSNRAQLQFYFLIYLWASFQELRTRLSVVNFPTNVLYLAHLVDSVCWTQKTFLRWQRQVNS